MKTFVKCILIVLCITLLTSTQLFGQEWSEEQKEVWQQVETSWGHYVKQDLEAWLRYFHDDYSGWNNQGALPINKDFIRKIVVHEFKTFKVLLYNIQPVAINIHGNVAIVQYYWSTVIKDAEGKETNESGRWTDIIMKENDMWFLIGDHGGKAAE
jgi:ketosteroid isomerase-like protein